VARPTPLDPKIWVKSRKKNDEEKEEINVGKFTVLLSSAYSEFQAYSKGLILSTYPTIDGYISGSSSAIFNS
jgi:hypothetical protein